LDIRIGLTKDRSLDLSCRCACTAPSCNRHKQAPIVPRGDEFNSRLATPPDRKVNNLTDPERVGLSCTPSACGHAVVARDPWAMPTAIESHAFGVMTMSGRLIRGCGPPPVHFTPLARITRSPCFAPHLAPLPEERKNAPSSDFISTTTDLMSSRRCQDGRSLSPSTTLLTQHRRMPEVLP
jgi:hypothetical protein